MNAARQRALVRLRRLYPDDFRRLYLNELEAAGVTGPCTQSGGGESDA